MQDIIDKVRLLGLVPVISIDDVKDAVPLAKALCKGGLPLAEITFRTACARDAIKIITEEVPEMLVGAGTVLTPEQMDSAIEAGAKFIVSPGFNPRVVKHAITRNIPIIPGCSGPSDMEAALEHGLKLVKFFPAEASGGLPAIKAMSAPYGNLKFMPTGGINGNNILNYLKFSKILACGGSYMVKSEYIKNGEFDRITQLTKDAMKQILGFTLDHIAITATGDEEAEKVAVALAALLDVEATSNNGKIHVGQDLQVIKEEEKDIKGCIAIGTNFIERAVYHLNQKGYDFDDRGIITVEDGRRAIYLKDTIAGFVIEIIEKL